MSESTDVKSGYTLTDNQTGQTIDLPDVAVTEGLSGIDISQLRAKFKHEAVDPALGDVSIGKSEITYIDGDKGILRYRGYSIEQLTEQSSFMEVVYLLRNGELPNEKQLTDFEQEMVDLMYVDESVEDVIKAFPVNADPMVVLQAATLALSNSIGPNSSENIIATMPVLVSMVIRHAAGKGASVLRDRKRGYTENFLNMCFNGDSGAFNIDPVMIRAMDKFLILHADHEQNASTTAARQTRSTEATKIVSVANAIGALSGPRHGGANTAVLKMLEKIGSVENIPDAIARAKDKADGFLVMGFGHRVYKSYDPRAQVLKGSVDDLLRSLKVSDVRLDIARELEKMALEDPYFKSKQLFPNVDFYSGIAFAAMGFKPNTFTTLFAFGRTPGWIAHIEEVDRNKERITRPRQSYVGYKERPYVPMEERTAGHNSVVEDSAPRPAA